MPETSGSSDRVLVVEDDHDVRESLAILIDAWGFAVETAANGKEALDKIDAGGRPCLIILDLMMPVMDGWALRKNLLGEPTLARIPVVVLSAIADVRQQMQALQAVDYLTKPVNLDKAYRLVASHC